MIKNQLAYIFVFLIIIISCRNTADKIATYPNDSNTVVAPNDITTQSNPLPLLLSFNQSECKIKCKLQEQIISKKYISDTLYLKIASVQDCNVHYSAEIESFKNDTMFLQIANKMNAGTLCYCLYYFDFTIGNLKSVPKFILMNGHNINRNFEFTPPVLDTSEM